MNSRWWVLLGLFFAVFKLQNAPLVAQSGFGNAFDIPVLQGNDTLYNAWAGGLNNPQLWPDTSRLGVDYWVFDREGDKLLQFNLVDGRWRQVEVLLNNPFTHWMVPVALKSGDYVYMTGNFQGRTRAYQPIANSAGFFFLPTFDSLTFEDKGSTKILTVGFIDVPGFADVNGDGDVDIINFEPLGGYIDYFENQAVEKGVDEANFEIELVDRCWGEFYESGITRSVDLDSCVADRFGKQPGVRHAGSTVSVVDLNNDSLFDVVLGDLNFATLVQLTNGGTPEVADMVSQDTLFPSNDPVDMPNFPGAYFMDIDGDSLLDFLAAPNSQSGSIDVENVWHYRNTGTATQPQFTLQQKDFLVGSMIDVGTQAYPALWDYNQDGLLDLVIGSKQRHPNRNTTNSGLVLYENTGTATEPVFTWVTNDYAGIRSLGLLGVSPTFGDLDKDGDDDMVIGSDDGRVHFFRNTAAAGQLPNFVLVGPQWFDIDVGSAAAPVLSDRNGDGLLDMVIGERSGNVNLFLNQGTTGQPSFNSSPDEQVYGGIDVRQGGLPFGQSRPVFVQFSPPSDEEMLVGSQLGNLFHYNDLDQASFTLQDTSFFKIDVGNVAAPAAGDLNGDGKTDLVIGTSRGGVELFYQGRFIGQPKRERGTFSIYPNPAQQVIQWQLANFRQGTTYRLWNAMGQLMKEGVLAQPSLPINELPKGLYWLELSHNSDTKVATFVKQ